MLVLGIVLLLVNYFLLHVPFLSTVAIILIVVGALVEIAGALGHAIGGRRHWY